VINILAVGIKSRLLPPGVKNPEIETSVGNNINWELINGVGRATGICRALL
jgi:hypothetical protein